MNFKNLVLFIALIIVSFLYLLKDSFLFPLIDRARLNAANFPQKLKMSQGKPETRDRIVWQSKKLAVRPPVVVDTSDTAKVLAADPNTWIDVNLSTQTLCLFHGGGTNCFLVSTGMPYTPTVTGTFSIWTKLSSTKMSGPGYYLPGVPWTMYFYRGYGIHGTYWHNNFGHPMSHGCVNMRTPEAQFVYDRVSVGTKVFVHY